MRMKEIKLKKKIQRIRCDHVKREKACSSHKNHIGFMRAKYYLSTAAKFEYDQTKYWEQNRWYWINVIEIIYFGFWLMRHMPDTNSNFFNHVVRAIVVAFDNCYGEGAPRGICSASHALRLHFGEHSQCRTQLFI